MDLDQTEEEPVSPIPKNSDYLPTIREWPATPEHDHGFISPLDLSQSLYPRTPDPRMTTGSPGSIEVGQDSIASPSPINADPRTPDPRRSTGLSVSVVGSRIPTASQSPIDANAPTPTPYNITPSLGSTIDISPETELSKNRIHLPRESWWPPADLNSDASLDVDEVHQAHFPQIRPPHPQLQTELSNSSTKTQYTTEDSGKSSGASTAASTPASRTLHELESATPGRRPAKRRKLEVSPGFFAESERSGSFTATPGRLSASGVNLGGSRGLSFTSESPGSLMPTPTSLAAKSESLRQSDETPMVNDDSGPSTPTRGLYSLAGFKSESMSSVHFSDYEEFTSERSSSTRIKSEPLSESPAFFTDSLGDIDDTFLRDDTPAPRTKLKNTPWLTRCNYPVCWVCWWQERNEGRSVAGEKLDIWTLDVHNARVPSINNWTPFGSTPTLSQVVGSGGNDKSDPEALNHTAFPRSWGNERIDVEIDGERYSSQSMDLGSD